MKNPLAKWFVLWLLAMLLLMSVYGIFGPKGRQIALDEVNFKSTQSSELYFKNMRSFFYDVEEHAESGYIVYRIDSRGTVNFAIYRNWRMQEAYIVTESESMNLEKKGLQLITSANDTIKLKSLDSESHYLFAARLYSYLSENDTLSYLQQEKSLQLPLKDVKSLRTSLKDYFKLVGKIK